MPMTAAQIVTRSCQIARVPGFTVQGGQSLNVILSELCQTYDFALARGLFAYLFNSATGTNSGPYAMPADYLRTEKDEAWYTVDGVPYRMVSIDLAEYDNLVQQTGIANFPQYFATDMSQTPPQLFVWPPPSGSYPVSQRYFKQMPDIVTPETSADIPWFPDQNYLITRLAGELMKDADDERAAQYLGDGDAAGTFPGAQAILRKYLQMKDDKSGRSQRVSLDRRFFGPAFDRLKNTKRIGW